MPFLREHPVQDSSYGAEDLCNCIVLTDELPIHSVRKASNQKSKRKITISGVTVPSYLDTFLLVGMRNGAILFLDVFNGLVNQMHFQAHNGTITDMHYRRERKELFVVGRGLVDVSFSVHVWQLPELEFLYRVTDLKDITCFAFSATMDVFALGSSQGSVHLFISNSSSSSSSAAVVIEGSEKNKNKNKNGEVGGVEASSNAVSKPSVKEVYKPDQYHDATVNAIKFCDDLSIFVSASEDGVIKIWNFEKCLIRSLKLNMPCGGVIFNGKVGDILVVQGAYLLTIAKTMWDDGNAIEHMENNRDPWTLDTIEKAAISTEEATLEDEEKEEEDIYKSDLLIPVDNSKNLEQAIGSLENSIDNKNNVAIVDDDSADIDAFEDASSRNASKRSATKVSIRASTISTLLSSNSRSTITQQRGTKINSGIQRRDTKLEDAYPLRASNVNDIKRSTTISLNKNSKGDTIVPPQVGSAITYSKADNLSFLKNSLTGAKHSLVDPTVETGAKSSIFKALTEGVDREAFVTQKKTLCSSLNPLFNRDSNYSKLLVVRNRSNVLMHPMRSEITDDRFDGVNYLSSDPSHQLTGNYRSNQQYRSDVIDVLHPRFLIRTKPSVREEHLYERIDHTLQQLANQNSAIIDAKSRGVAVHDNDSVSIEEKHMKRSEDGVMGHDNCNGNNNTNNKQSIQSWQNTHKVAQLGLSPRARLTLISSRPVAIGADAQEELQQILLDAAGMGISADYRRHINHVKEQRDAIYKQLISKSSPSPHRLAIRKI